MHLRVLGLGAVPVVVHGMGQLVVGGHVELPELLLLPGCQRRWVDRLDVHVGEQGEHPQAVGRGHAVGELADGVVPAEVAPHQRGRHFQMIFDEKADPLPVVLAHFQPLHNLFHNFPSGLNVAVRIDPFPDVVKQKHEEQNFRLFEFRVDFAKTLQQGVLFAFRCRAAAGRIEVVEVLDGEQ